MLCLWLGPLQPGPFAHEFRKNGPRPTGHKCLESENWTSSDRTPMLRAWRKPCPVHSGPCLGRPYLWASLLRRRMAASMGPHISCWVRRARLYGTTPTAWEFRLALSPLELGMVLTPQPTRSRISCWLQLTKYHLPTLTFWFPVERNLFFCQLFPYGSSNRQYFAENRHVRLHRSQEQTPKVKTCVVNSEVLRWFWSIFLDFYASWSVTSVRSLPFSSWIVKQRLLINYLMLFLLQIHLSFDIWCAF